VDVATRVDAKKNTIGYDEAIRLAREADLIVSAKGKTVKRLDLKKDKPDDAAIAALVIGPSGNLRAPAFFVGKRLMIGFEEESYRDLLT
jgi:arsenate reductase-like glutaredoxin family protein